MNVVLCERLRYVGGSFLVNRVFDDVIIEQIAVKIKLQLPRIGFVNILISPCIFLSNSHCTKCGIYLFLEYIPLYYYEITLFPIKLKK